MVMEITVSIMLICARWYAAYPLSLRHIEEMMQKSGVFADHSTVRRWALKILPVLARVFRKRKRYFGTSWRMVETHTTVEGQWKYLYCAADKAGDTVDFLLTAKQDTAAAQRYLERVIDLNDLPEKFAIHKSGANAAAIHSVTETACLDIELHQCNHLNNIIEQNHQATKRVTVPMLGFKSFWSARKLLAGIETMHMIKKGQLHCPKGQSLSAAQHFYGLAF
jgi:transposase-like protein